MKAIGQLGGVNESRISQKLKAKVAKTPTSLRARGCFEDISGKEILNETYQSRPGAA